MKIYATLGQYAEGCGFSEITAKRRLKEGILEKVEATRGNTKIAGYVDIYEANLYFANAVAMQHIINFPEPRSTFGKAILGEKNLQESRMG